jgi:hypothetical protein
MIRIIVGLLVLFEALINLVRLQKNFDGPRMKELRAKNALANVMYPVAMVFVTASCVAVFIAGIVVLRKGL